MTELAIRAQARTWDTFMSKVRFLLEAKLAPWSQYCFEISIFFWNLKVFLYSFCLSIGANFQYLLKIQLDQNSKNQEKMVTWLWSFLQADMFFILFLIKMIKFSFSEKAAKFAQSSSWFWRSLSKFQNHKDDSANFCGLLRKAEL